MTTGTVGFLGLGQMGRPMARNLVKGHGRVIAAARSAASLQGLDGVETTTEIGRLAEADVLFLCLSDGKAVDQVLFGETAGLAPRLKPGQVVVDLGTSDYAATLGVAKRLEAAGVGFLDAPISGMEARAIAGTLTVMCGGEAAVFERIKPLFERIGELILHVGPVGSGQLVKLINQLLFDINAAALAEVLPVAAKLGVDPDQVGAVINSGTGRSYASEFFIPRILRGHFSDGYPMKDAYKDLVSGAAISAEMGLPMPVLAAATATYQSALLAGHGEKDKGGMIRVFETLLGVTFRSAQQGVQHD